MNALDNLLALDAPTRDEAMAIMADHHGPLIAEYDRTASLAWALDAAVVVLRHYVHFATEEQAWAVALWAAATHAAPRCDIVPRLAVRAPTRQSGKTRLLEVLAGLVANAWGPLVGPSAAALYRKIEASHPTVLLDEVDRLFERKAEDNAAIVEVINAGHVRGATVPRVIGQGTKQTVYDFDVYTPMALAGIAANWPDTLLDRSIVITLERRKSDEDVAPFRQRMNWQTQAIGEELAYWLADVEHFRSRDLPAELSDRAQDNWEALFAIARAAGGLWPERAAQAAVTLGRKQATLMADDDRDEVQLLNDIIVILREEESGFIGSTDLVRQLEGLDDRPWSDWPGGFSTHKLAKLLRRLGIRPTQPFGSARRGYDRKVVAAVHDRIGTLPSV